MLTGFVFPSPYVASANCNLHRRSPNLCPQNPECSPAKTFDSFVMTVVLLIIGLFLLLFLENGYVLVPFQWLPMCSTCVLPEVYEEF